MDLRGADIPSFGGQAARRLSSSPKFGARARQQNRQISIISWTSPCPSEMICLPPLSPTHECHFPGHRLFTEYTNQLTPSGRWQIAPGSKCSLRARNNLLNIGWTGCRDVRDLGAINGRVDGVCVPRESSEGSKPAAFESFSVIHVARRHSSRQWGSDDLVPAYTGEDGRTQYRMMIGRRLSTPVRPKRCSRLTSAKYLYPESESLSFE